jgi:hypothetical protein
VKLWINNTLPSSFKMSELDKGPVPVKIVTLTSNTLTTCFTSLRRNTDGKRSAHQQSPELWVKAAKLTAISGVGERTAALLLAQMPELDNSIVVSSRPWLELAPFNRNSGKLRGKRAIYGGRRRVRHGVYRAALVPARHSPKLPNFYLRLRAAGKPAKVALSATMRKLLIVLNSSRKPDLTMLETRQLLTAGRCEVNL